MPHIFECPKCGVDIGDSYQAADPDVGIGAGWFCDACNEGYDDEDGPESFDDDVGISGGSPSADRCPKCLSTNLEIGYGLAGGGMGPYSFCPRCEVIVHKSQDPT